MAEENVLVVKRSLFEKWGAFQGFRKADAVAVAPLLRRENTLFLPRSAAENDPSHKQLIPYAVFIRDGRVLHYVRGGRSGEKRLVAKGSIGIGGHINDSDESLFAFDAEAYHAAVRREIAEELRIEGTWEEEIVGVLNDDSTEVGRVHLGIVHRVRLDDGRVTSGEKAISRLEFLDAAELRRRRDGLETWSQILVDHLGQIDAVFSLSEGAAGAH